MELYPTPLILMGGGGGEKVNSARFCVKKQNKDDNTR